MPPAARIPAQRPRRRSPALQGTRQRDPRAPHQAPLPEVTTALHHRNAWELLVATILSAQSTDDVVNQVTAVLFQRSRR